MVAFVGFDWAPVLVIIPSAQALYWLLLSI